MSFSIPLTQDIAAKVPNPSAPWKISSQVNERIELKPHIAGSSFKKCLLFPADSEMEFVKSYFLADKPKGLEIHRVYCIENINSEKVFEPNLSQMEVEARNPQFQPNWREAENSQERTKVFQRWQSMVQVFSSFKPEDGKPEIHQAKVLPLWLRGESEELSSIFKTAGSIQDTSSPSNDPLSASSGSFGDGAYFTNSSCYASLYSPTYLVLAWVSMREPYPVVHDQSSQELGTDRELLIGKKGYQNYNAHHVPVALINSPAINSYSEYYQNENVTCDEFVVFNQAQRINRFWIELKKEGSNLPYSFNEAMNDAEDGSLDKLKAWLGEDSDRLQQKTQEGETLLYAALYGNQLETIKYLLSKNPSLVEHVREDRKSLLFLAVLGGRREILNWLLAEQVLAYSREQFEKEARNFGYSEDRIEKALKSVGWLKPVLPSCPAHVRTRKDLLSKLEEKFSGNPYKTFAQASLVGPGGVGKSTLAKFYAREHQNRYSFVFWMKAGESPQSSLKDLGIRLGIVEVDSPKPLEADSPEKVKVDPHKESLDRVKHYLKNNPGWLLIFDEVENPSSIDALFPGFKAGHILITSRDDSASQKVQIGSFSPEESISFLSSYTRNDDEKGAKALAEELGHFPLALTQAGAYIFENSESFSSYLNLYLTERKELIDLKSDHEEYPYSAAATWTISLKKLKETTPQAVSILNRAFYLAPNDIPKYLLGKEGLPPEALDSLLDRIRRYSLLTSGSSTDTFSIHRLIQTTLKDLLPPLEREYAKSTLQKNFEREWLFDSENTSLWEKARTIVHHLKAFCALEEYPEETSSEIAAKFFRDLGSYFSSVEIDLPLAIKLLNISISIAERLGKEELQAFTLNCLGRALSSQGKLKEATQKFEKSLKISRKIHKGYHPAIATALNNLGVVYQHQGDLPKAKETYEEVLKIEEKNIKEKNHEEHKRDIRSTLHNLGTIYRELGDIPRAIDFHERALKVNELDHEKISPHVVQCLHSLGSDYLAFEDPNLPEAIRCYTEALEAGRKLYGNNHPTVANIIQSLGVAYKTQGKLSEGIQHYKEAVQIWKNNYGEEHPYIVACLRNLAEAYLDEGKLSLAISTYKKALEMAKKTHEETHFIIGKIHQGLGEAYNRQKNRAKAIDCYKQAITAFKASHKKPHLDTVHSLFSLSRVHEEEENLLEAYQAYEEGFEYLEKVLGKGDRKLVKHCSKLISLQDELRAWREAEE